MPLCAAAWRPGATLIETVAGDLATLIRWSLAATGSAVIGRLLEVSMT